MRRLKSLKKIVKEEVLKKRPNNVIFDFKHDEFSNNVNLSSPPNPFLKIRNPYFLYAFSGLDGISSGFCPDLAVAVKAIKKNQTSLIMMKDLEKQTIQQ